MNQQDRLAYLDALQVCVNIATLNGYTPEQVANDIRLLITPPAGNRSVCKISFLTTRSSI